MMRYIMLSLNLTVLLACGMSCATAEKSESFAGLEGSEIRVYEVFGMDCPGCHGGVEKLVKQLPAVHQAEANWQKKKLIVAVHPGYELADEDVYDAIRRANFTPGKRIK